MSVARLHDTANLAESGYVGYEMWVRRLETRVEGIIGASGCFYAIRRELHSVLVPEALSRDFAAPLTAKKHGLRAVSVDGAVCYIPRTSGLPWPKNQLKNCWSAWARVTSVAPGAGFTLMGVAPGPE